MPVRSWFPTLVYRERLAPRGADAFNAALLDSIVRIREQDAEGREWCRRNYPGGYTSYASMPSLHRIASDFAELERRVLKHAQAFARELDYDLEGGKLEMVDCWVNVLPPGASHGSHIHPLSVISGTYYVQVPRGASSIKFEDPRLAMFMGTPPVAGKRGDRSRRHVAYAPKAGDVILFESWLRHEVPANLAKAERISVSFNLR
jgi:uncharacterized protein (TIGR02466 family)